MVGSRGQPSALRRRHQAYKPSHIRPFHVVFATLRFLRGFTQTVRTRSPTGLWRRFSCRNLRMRDDGWHTPPPDSISQQPCSMDQAIDCEKSAYIIGLWSRSLVRAVGGWPLRKIRERLEEGEGTRRELPKTNIRTKRIKTKKKENKKNKKKEKRTTRKKKNTTQAKKKTNTKKTKKKEKRKKQTKINQKTTQKTRKLNIQKKEDTKKKRIIKQNKKEQYQTKQKHRKKNPPPTPTKQPPKPTTNPPPLSQPKR